MPRKSLHSSINNLSYKSLLIILFFLLINIVILWKFVLPKSKVEASWWNDGWNYRKAISINNSGAAQTNTQIKILNNYDLSALVTAGKLQADLDDLRFTDSNGNLLKYWIEDSTNNSVDVWAFLPSIPTSGATVYMYYGNPSATNGETIVGTKDNPGLSCKAVKLSGGTLDNIYYIDPTGGNVADALQIFCDLNTDSGGWMLIGKSDSTIYTHAPGFFADGDIPTKTNRGSINVFNLSLVDNTAEWMWQDTVNNQYVKFSLTKYSTIKSSPDNYTKTNDDTGQRFISSTITSASSLYQFTAVGNSQVPANAGSFSYATSSSSYGSWGQAYYAGGLQTNIRGFIISNYGGHEGAYGRYGLQRYNPSPYIATNSVMMVRESAFYIDSNFSSTFATEEAGGGPIAYWKFDEGSGTTAYDSTSNQLNGTLQSGTSAPTWANESQCISGKCLDFKGSTNYVYPGSQPKLDNLEIFTLSAWINMRARKYIPTIINKGPERAAQHFWWGINSNNKIWMELGDSTNYATYQSNSLSWSLNKWYFLSVTVNNQTKEINFYRDGKLINTSSFTGRNFNTGTYATSIGRYYSNSPADYDWNGYLDDIKIYPYARTAAQIKQDYNSRGSSKGTSANLGSAASDNNLSDGLVGYWKMDEGYGTTTSNWGNGGTTLNGTFGTGSSAPTWTNDGKFSKALSFDGSDYVQLFNTTLDSIGASGDFTISSWNKQSSFSGVEVILGQGYAGAPGGHTYGRWQMGTTGSKGWISLYGGSSSPSYKQLTGTTNLLTNVWNQITAVFSRSEGKLKLYINGKFDSQLTWDGYIENVYANRVVFGYNSGTNDQYMNGLIDEVKIYNYALNSDEIKQDYNQSSALQMGQTSQTIGGTTTSLEYCIPGDTSYCASPIAEYKFDEGVGTTANDTSGNNINTGFNGTPTWTQGKIGKSLNFNGSTDYLRNTRKVISGGLTFGVWIKTTSTDSATVYDGNAAQNIIGDSTGGVALGFGVHGGKVRYQHYAGAWYNVLGATSVNNGLWHYISVTHNSSTGAIIIYVDGKQDGSGTISYNGSSAYDVIARGYSADHFTGQLDQIRIYNYVRTPAQIAYDYNKGGPVGWWKFDECQGNIAYDWSGIGNTGTIIIGASGTQNSLGTCAVGTSAAWTNGSTGKLNSSLNFDGTDDYINAGTNSSLNITGDFSLSVWVKPTTNSNCYGIVDKSSGGSGRQAPYLFWRCGQTFNFYRGNGSSYDSLITSKNYPANNWYYITIVSGTNNKIYINGILDNTASKTLTYTGNSNPLIIGSMSTTPSLPISGQIDDVRIYNYALTPEQVKTLYNNGAVSFN